MAWRSSYWVCTWVSPPVAETTSTNCALNRRGSTIALFLGFFLAAPTDTSNNKQTGKASFRIPCLPSRTLHPWSAGRKQAHIPFEETQHGLESGGHRIEHIVPHGAGAVGSAKLEEVCGRKATSNAE